MEKGPEQSSKASKDAATTVDTKCTVCHKTFCEPKLLPCGHLMCRKCLLSWLKQTRRATCPYCRYPILKDERNSSPAAVSSTSKEDTAQSWEQGTEWDSDHTLTATVDQFPTDLSMAAMVKAESLLNKKDKKCHVCDDIATSFCFHCHDTLCTACHKNHGKIAALRHHRVEELNGLTAGRLADFQPPTPCPQHPDEPCRFFCLPHDTSLCVTCATSRHRECQQVAEFHQLVEQAKMKLQELIKVMTDSSAEIEGTVLKLDQHLVDIEQRTETALADIQTLKEGLTKAVENFCQQLVQRVTEAREDIRESVKEAKIVLLSRQSMLGTHTALAQRVLSSTARDVVCGMTSVMETRIKDLDRHTDLPENSKVINTVTLAVDNNPIDRVVQELTRLVDVKVNVSSLFNVYERFHRNHGQNITLSNHSRTATQTKYGFNIVVVNRPLAVGELVEVQIDQWDTTGQPEFPYLGVTEHTEQSPDTLNLQQQQWLSNIPSATVITAWSLYNSGTYQKCSVGEQLRSLSEGSRVGVYLDASLNLHLYIDGQDKGFFCQQRGAAVLRVIRSLCKIKADYIAAASTMLTALLS